MMIEYHAWVSLGNAMKAKQKWRQDQRGRIETDEAKVRDTAVKMRALRGLLLGCLPAYACSTWHSRL
jgi:hypothetical protein